MRIQIQKDALKTLQIQNIQNKEQSWSLCSMFKTGKQSNAY